MGEYLVQELSVGECGFECDHVVHQVDQLGLFQVHDEVVVGQSTYIILEHYLSIYLSNCSLAINCTTASPLTFLSQS
jgi:hypothetical protein